MQNTRLLAGALALTALSAGLAACRPGVAGAAHHSSAGQVNEMSSSANAMAPSAGSTTAQHPTGGSGAGFGYHPTPTGHATGSGGGLGASFGQGRYDLQPMPTGTVSISQLADKRVQAKVDMFGLTPGSAHQVSIVDNLAHTVQFPVLTADAAGRADATLTSLNAITWPPEPSQFVVHLGDSTTDPMAAQPIAKTSLPPRFAIGFTLPLNAVDIGAFGPDRPSGRTTISYNAAAQTLSVTVTAFGLNPGPHAAHIHLGSCQSQGPVQYMLADFVADRDGNIVNQTRTVSGVPTIPAPGTWYLNLHQGGMNQILANGTPTLLFRPLLCTNISSIATTGRTTPPMAPSSSITWPPTSAPTAPPTPTMPATSASTPMPSPTTPGTTSPAPSGSPSSPSSPSTVYPTHW